MRCPHCQEESFAKKKKLTENWKVIGEIEVCALCGKEWKKSAPDSGKRDKDSASKARLAVLLGGDVPEKVELAGIADRKFCRNCRYFFVHPFKSICSLTDKETDPMGECGRFEEKKPDGQ